MYVGKSYGDFANLHKRLRTELPGKVIPPLPRKNKASTMSSAATSAEDDEQSISSVSTQETNTHADEGHHSSSLTPGHHHHRHKRSTSRSSRNSATSARSNGKSPRASEELPRETVLFREEQRVSLRAFLRTLLQNKRIAESKSVQDFLTAEPIHLTHSDLVDLERRKATDGVRVGEQQRFYEIAKQRAAELDVYMESFRRDIVEDSELMKWDICFKPPLTVQQMA